MQSAFSAEILQVTVFVFQFGGAMARIVNGTPHTKMATKSLDEDRKKLWECVRTNDGISVSKACGEMLPYFARKL